MQRYGRPLAVVLLMTVLGLLVYSPSLGGEFAYDDHRFVARNPALRSLSPKALADFFIDPSTVDPEGNWEGIYRPLRSLSYAIDHAFFGTNPVGYRIHSLLLHVAASLALAVLLGRLLRRPLLGYGLGCVFLIHPVQVESVAWVTSRSDVQAGLFGFLTLLAMRRQGAPAVWIGTGLLAAALLAKEAALVVPVIGLLLDLVWPGTKRNPGLAGIRRWLPAFALVLGYLLLRAALLGASGGQRPPWEGGVETTTASMTVGLGWYVWRLTVPFGFLFDYQLPPKTTLLDLAVIGLGALYLIGMGVLTVLLMRRRFVHVGAGIWWFLIALGPVSNVLVPINILVAERFLYLPAGGWMLALGGAALLVWNRAPAARWFLPVAAAGWILWLGVTAHGFARKWSTEETLWTAVVAHSPDHYRGYHGLAKCRVFSGDYEGAREALRMAIASGGGVYPEVYFDLGRTYLLENRHREAVPYLRRAVILWHGEGESARNRAYIQTLSNLHEIYARVGDAGSARTMQTWLEEARGKTE